VAIRDALPSDAEAIASLLLEAFQEFEPLYTGDGFRATTPAGDEVRRRLTEGPIWVTELAGTIVSSVSAVSKVNGLYLRSLAVHPAARGRGVGRQLLATVEAFARAHRTSRLFLSTTPFLAAAIQLYERGGFRRTDEGPHDLFGTPLFTMVKELNYP
jgi:ribosomal protein S18 acetylase RimI-like enzyme